MRSNPTLSEIRHLRILGLVQTQRNGCIELLTQENGHIHFRNIFNSKTLLEVLNLVRAPFPRLREPVRNLLSRPLSASAVEEEDEEI